MRLIDCAHCGRHGIGPAEANVRCPQCGQMNLAECGDYWCDLSDAEKDWRNPPLAPDSPLLRPHERKREPARG